MRGFFQGRGFTFFSSLNFLVLQRKVDQLFASVFKGAPPEHVRVEVVPDEIRVYRHDMVYEDVLATKVSQVRNI